MEIVYVYQGEFRSVVVDATVREQHTRTAKATEHMVAQGANLTDHLRKERNRLSAECHVSNTPVLSPNVDGAEGSPQSYSVEGSARSMAKGAKVSDSGEVTEAEWETAEKTYAVSALQFSGDFDRVQAVFDQLDLLQEEALELTVVTSLGQYDSMLLEEIDAPRDAKSRHACSFSLLFKAVSFAETETVGTPEPLETRAERERRLGAQSAEEPESGEDVSLAASLLEEATGMDLIHAPRRSGRGVFTR